MSELPLVSILVPFYQVERYIERCARSIFNQSYQHLEFIFINDASMDKSLDILSGVLLEYPHFSKQTKLVNHSQNQGIAACRNECIKLCSGDFMTWVDADDYLEPQAILRMVDCQQKSNADIVNGNVVEHTEDKKCEYALFPNENREDILVGLLSFSIRKNLWGRLIRTSLYRDNQICFIDGVNYHEDFQVLTRLVYCAKRVANVDTVIYHYDRQNISSLITLARKDLGNKLIKDQQDLLSVKVLRSFFSDKEQPYPKLANEIVVYYLREILRDATRAKEKKLFMDTSRELSIIDKQYVQRYGKSLWIMSRISPSICWFMKRIRCILLERKNSL